MNRLLAYGALACALALPAAAFRPDDTVAEGHEPVRTWRWQVERQRELLRAPAWQDFLAGEGRGWTVRFDEITGAPLRMYGRGIPLGPVDGEAAAVAAVRDFVARHAGLLRASPKQLGTGTAGYSADRATWYVDLPIVVEGVPVWNARITARIVDDRLVMLGVEGVAGLPREGAALLSPEEARQIAAADGLAPDAEHRDVRVTPTWLPLERGPEVVLVRSLMVESATDAPRGRWVHLIHAETGEVLAAWNQIRFFTGTVDASHHPRHVGQDLMESPLVGLRIENAAGDRAVTDLDGRFTLEGDGLFGSLRGPELVVRDASRRNRISTFPITDNDTVVTGFGDISQPELSSWVHIHEAKAWGREVAPEVEVGNGRGGPLRSNVNVDGNCNAFYDGESVNFFTAGRGCTNTALSADVNHHEWGHGFHANSLRAGRFDGALSEGAADTVAFLMSGDHVIAPYFIEDGRGIRDVEPDRVYPQDVVNQVHTDGLIFGGAMWDLREILIPELGEEEATRVTGSVLAGLLKAGPSLATSGEEALLADDDDGDLSNGTPHFCAIVEAFGAHGLVPEAGVSATLAHEQLVEAPPADGIRIVANVSEAGPSCIDLDAVEVVWRAEGGDWERLPATVDGGTIEAQLPDLPFGTFVEYYLEADGGRTRASVPAGGLASPLSLYVGGVIDLGLCNDFEQDDGGWTSELVAGEEREGADDWQWGPPGGRGGDPDFAASGRNVWGNDLGNDAEGRWNGQYQNEKHNRLTSPDFTWAPHLEGVFLRYARWLQVEDGTYDGSQILADGDVVWRNHASGRDGGNEHHLEDRWVRHSVPLGEASADGQVRLAFETISDEGLAFGGWTIDDVCLFAPATPDNRLAIVDFQSADDDEGGVTLTWTQPEHAPLAEVVVVRKRDGLPTGPDDGEVVHRDTDPELGAAAMAFDDTGRSGRTYQYAVYASDGQDWLSWTVEGWNADPGSGRGQPGGGLIAGGCGCTSAPSAPAGAAFLGLGLLTLALRRRRR